MRRDEVLQVCRAVSIRTRRKSPQHQRGVRACLRVVEVRAPLDREEITDGVMLADEAEHYRQIFNTIRPHEALEMRRPTDVYLTAVRNFGDPESEPSS